MSTVPAVQSLTRRWVQRPTRWASSALSRAGTPPTPLRRQAEARSLLTKIPYAATREAAEGEKRAFQTWAAKRGHAEAGRALDRDWERMVTFYQFPREHWKHLRTSNPVESPFAAGRLRTAAAKRFKRVDNATAVIWKTLLIAEKTFRRLDAPSCWRTSPTVSSTSTVCAL